MKTIKILLLTAGAVLLASGCGAITDKASEKAGEKIAESATGCDDVDVSDENVSAKCQDGDVNFNAGGDGEVPESWPVDLSVLNDAQINGSSEITSDGETMISLQATSDASVSEVVDSMTTDLEGAGYTQEGDFSSSDGDGAEAASITFVKGDNQVNVTVGGNPGEDGTQVVANATQPE